jgi:MFS family permease
VFVQRNLDLIAAETVMSVASERLHHFPNLTGKAAFWAVAAMVAVMFMGSTLVTPLYAPYRQAFGFAQVTLTLIYAVYAVGNLLALLIFGRVSDQIGRRPVGLAAIVLAALATVLFLLATSTAWLFAARLVSGFAIGLASGTGAAWLTGLVPGGDKSLGSRMAAEANFAGLSGLVSTITVAATRALESRAAMLTGLALFIPSVALLLVAQVLGSLALLLTCTALGGAAAALGFRGSLQVVNSLVPPDRRAEVVSTYYLVTFIGNSLPVIGVGIITATSNRLVANVVCAVTIAILAIIALLTGYEYRPPHS